MRYSRETEPGAEADARKHLNTDTVAGGIGFAFALAYLAAAFTIPEGSFTNAAVGPAALSVSSGHPAAHAAPPTPHPKGQHDQHDPEHKRVYTDEPHQRQQPEAMTKGGFQHIVVVSMSGIAGILSMRDLMRSLIGSSKQSMPKGTDS